MKRLLLLFAFILVGGGLRPFFSLAAVATTGGSTTASLALPGGDPGAIVTQIFNFALVISGLLAFVMIVWGGVKYAANPGNPSALDDAKDQIFQALLGILLLVGSALVLDTINPQIRLSGFAPTTAVQPNPTTSVCPSGCPAGQYCTALGCTSCGVPCASGQVCRILPSGQPGCVSCPADILSKCPAPSKCVAQGSNFTCVNKCGDGGKSGWCDPSSVCKYSEGNYDCEKDPCLNTPNDPACKPLGVSGQSH